MLPLLAARHDITPDTTTPYCRQLRHRILPQFTLREDTFHYAGYYVVVEGYVADDTLSMATLR